MGDLRSRVPLGHALYHAIISTRAARPGVPRSVFSTLAAANHHSVPVFLFISSGTQHPRRSHHVCTRRHLKRMASMNPPPVRLHVSSLPHRREDELISWISRMADIVDNFTTVFGAYNNIFQDVSRPVANVLGLKSLGPHFDVFVYSFVLFNLASIVFVPGFSRLVFDRIYSGLDARARNKW